MNSCSCSLYVVVRPSVVCLSSVVSLYVTFVHPTQPIEIFGNVSAPCNTLVTWRHPGKILRRSSQGNPSVGGVKPKSVRKKCSDFGLCEAISRKRCKIGGKLLLITNRKSHMGFRLVPNSMTLNDLERRNNFTDSGSFLGGLRKSGWRYTDYFPLQKCRPNNVVFNDILIMAILAGDQP